MRGEISKVAGTEQVEHCRQSAVIVPGPEQETITAGAHPPSTCSSHYYISFFYTYTMVHYRQTA